MGIDIIQTISQSIGTIVMNILILLFFQKKYGEKYRKKAIFIVVYLIWTALMFGVNQFQNPVLNMSYLCISSELICICFFNAKIKNSMLYNTMLILIVIFCDGLTFFIWSAVMGKTTDEIYQETNLMFISNLLYILVLFIAYRLFLLVVIKSDTKGLKIRETVFLLLLTILENFIVYNYTLKITDKADGIVVIALLICFLLFNIYITFLLKAVAEAYEYKYEISLLTRQSELQLENYRALDYKYKQSRKIVHDLKKHIDVYNDLKDTERSEKYKKLMDDELGKLFGGYQCSNAILSIIISQKCETAEKDNINVDIEMEDLPLTFINDLDITAIFANLWDNAIEACKELDQSQRNIKFIMRQVNKFAIINMENTCVDNMIIYDKSGGIISSKKNHMGVGLSIVESKVQDYHGFFHINRNDKEKFIVELTIPIT